MNRLLSNLAKVNTSCGSTTLPNLIGIVLAVAPPRVVKYRGRVPFIIIIFSFLATRTAYIREPISMNNGSKDAV